METLEWKGQHGPEAPGHAVASDAASWQLSWRRNLGQDAPPADFTKYVGVLVFAGRRTTGGYGFELAPETRGDDLVVRCRIKKPTGFVTQVLTEPWKARLFPRPKGRLDVEMESE